MSHRLREPSAPENESGLLLLQDLLKNHSGNANSQRTLSNLSVPGLWFASRGLQDIGMSTFQFDIDERMALRWNLQSDE
jgi:hypothetical protein